MLPDLNRLKIFYHVYARQSMKQAARDLLLTQPGVSQHIRKLETEIGIPLFTRGHKKIVPTQAGTKLFARIRPFIETLEVEIKSISAPMDRPSGTICMGAPLEFGKNYLPGICHRFREEYNQVNFAVRLEEPDKLLTMIDRGELDFALIDYFSARDQLPAQGDVYNIVPLIKETFILACSQGYFKDRLKKNISFENLVTMEFLTDEHDPVILRHWFRHYFKRPLPDLNFVMAIDSHPAMLSCIRLGMGLGITSSHLIKADERNRGVVPIVPIFPEGEKAVNHISLVQLRNKKPTFTDKIFQDYLIKEMKETALGWGNDTF